MRHVRWIGFLVVVALAIMVSGAALAAAPAVEQAGGVYTIQPDAADGCPPGPRPTLY
jgi:hypothetical protein